MKVFGASGHGKVIAEIGKMSNPHKEISFIDDRGITEFFGMSVAGRSMIKEDDDLIIAVGDNALRKRIVSEIGHNKYINLLHSSAHISASAKLGNGVVCMAGVTVNADADIGNHVILNTGCIIEHDCKIGDYVHISPKAALAGNITVGEGTQIGIGASVIQGLRIGRWAIIGAGAAIIDDVPDFGIVVGVPGRLIKLNSKNER